MSILFYVLHVYRPIFDMGPYLGGRVPFQTLKSEWERQLSGSSHRHWLAQ